QAIFTVDRPRTRLAREYDDVADAIRIRNLADRDTVLKFLEQPFRYLGPNFGDIKGRLQRIRTHYLKDGVVLNQLASAYRHLGLSTEAGQLMQEAEHQGFQSEETLQRLARERYSDL